MLDFLASLIPDYDQVAIRVKKAMALDGQGMLDSVIAARLANALRILDDADSMALFRLIQKTQQMKCIQDGVELLRKEFLIIHRS